MKNIYSLIDVIRDHNMTGLDISLEDFIDTYYISLYTSDLEFRGYEPRTGVKYGHND